MRYTPRPPVRALISELRHATVVPSVALPTYLLTVVAPTIPPERFLEAPVDGERLFWDASGSEPEPRKWVFAGLGVAARIDGTGRERLPQLREQARRCFSTLVERGSVPEAPSARLFGGLSFFAPDAPDASDADAAVWGGFADASFVLPRWLYARRDDAAVLRLAVSAGELESPELLVEVDRVLAYVARIAGASSIVPSAQGAVVLDRDDVGLEAWTVMLERALIELRGGALDKVVLARRSALSLDRALNVVSALGRMRADSTATRFLFERAGGTFVGASPERLFALRGRTLETDALAGSAARKSRDGHSSFPLQHSQKDHAEHAYVVHGIEAALAALTTRIEREPTPRLRTLRNIHHLWTPITAELRDGPDAADVLAALHPTPAVCGLPTETAARFIAAHEPTARGWYAAPVGWLDAAGDATFAVAIRSAMLRGRRAYLFAGAGIVRDSEPAAEYRETSTKLETMLRALGITKGSGEFPARGA